jgi:hypothetical protein
MNSNYGVARGIFSLVELLGWLVVAAGIVVATVGLGAGTADATVFAITSGIGLLVGGFISVAGAQIGRANVDTADNTQRILEILKEQSSRHSPTAHIYEQDFKIADKSHRGEETIDGDGEVNIVNFRGREFEVHGNGVTYLDTMNGRRRFSNLQEAKDYIR